MGAGADGGAVDGSDRRLVELPQVTHDGLHAGAQRFGGRPGVEPLAAGLGDGRRSQVHPRAEGVAGAGEEHGPDAGIAPRPAHGGQQVVAHLDGEGILGLGPVEHDREDAIVTRGGADHGCDLTHRAQSADSADDRHKPHS